MALDRTKVLEAAQKYLGKGQHEKAIAEYQKLVAADPNDVRTWLKIGDLYTRLGDSGKACETYGRVADHYTKQGFFRKAVAVYKQILKLDPARLDVLLALGDMYEQLQLTSDALMTFENVANEYLKQGDTDRALETLSRMVQLDSENIPIRIKYAEALSKAGRTEDAADSFEIGAQLLDQLGRYDDYMKVAERLLYHRSEDHELASKLARMYLERNDPKRALSKLQICFQADPTDVETLQLLAASFEALGQVPKTVSVYKEIARLHQQAGRLEERAVILKAILELDPGDTETRRALASYAPPSTTLPTTPSAPPPSAVISHGDAHVEAVPLDDDSVELLDDDSAIFLTEDDNVVLTENVEEFEELPAEQNLDELEELPSREMDMVPMVGEPSGLLILDEDEDDQETGQRGVLPAPSPQPTAPEVAPSRRDDSAIELFAPMMEEGEDDFGVPAGVPAAPTAEAPAADSAGMLDILVDDVQTGSIPNLAVGAEDSATGTSEIPSIPPDVAREAQIARLLTECDVFERYGLQGKVIQQLGRVLEVAPEHVEARERLKDAHIDAGQYDLAIGHLYELAHMFQAERPKVAILYFRQIVDLAPEHEPARNAVSTYRSEAPPDAYGLEAPLDYSAEAQLPPPAGAILSAEPAAGTRMRTSTQLGWPGRDDPPPPAATLPEDTAGPPVETHAALPDGPLADATLPGLGDDESTADPFLGGPSQTDTESSSEGTVDFPPPVAAVPPPAAPIPWKPPPPKTVLGGKRPSGGKGMPAPKIALGAPAASGKVPPKRVPARAPSLPPHEVEEILGEAEFFSAQGLFEEARTTLQDVLDRHPGHPALLQRLSELAEQAAAQEIASAPPMSGEDEAFQLAEKLAEELDEDSSPTEAGAEMIDVETVFAQFKRGVKEQIGEQDSETHFDLGIAYKEMGLLDDAIEEFELAKGNPDKACIALTMIGLCQVEKGIFSDAVGSFKKGLQSDRKTATEELGLFFELGIAYELMGDRDEALYYFRKVATRDNAFRSVEDRIARLEQGQSGVQRDPKAAADDMSQELDELLGE